MKISIIGAGVMGSAYARAWVTNKLIVPKNLTICDPDTKKLFHNKRTLGVRTSSDNCSAIHNADIVLLAVKPQQMYAVLDELNRSLQKNQLIISIAAGVTVRSIEKILKNRQPVIRAMPNLALTVGAGLTAWCANKYVSTSQRKTVYTLLSAHAIAINMPEHKLNAVTAISGAGPGYVCAFADALMKAAASIGLPKQDARTLVHATIMGSGKLLASSQRTPSELISCVASKGGATEAALKIFKQKKLAEIISAAVRAAHRRARQLSR